MPNITIEVDEDVLRWARLRAAQRNTSVARLVGDLLKERMHASVGYEAARQRFMAARPRKLSLRRYPSRGELHDRARLR